MFPSVLVKFWYISRLIWAVSAKLWGSERETKVSCVHMPEKSFFHSPRIKYIAITSTKKRVIHYALDRILFQAAIRVSSGYCPNTSYDNYLSYGGETLRNDPENLSFVAICSPNLPTSFCMLHILINTLSRHTYDISIERS